MNIKRTWMAITIMMIISSILSYQFLLDRTVRGFYLLINPSAVITGWVSHIDTIRSVDGPSVRIKYKYKHSNSAFTNEEILGLGTSMMIKMGDQVSVRYSPSNPQYSSIRTKNDFYHDFLLAMGIGIGC